MYGEIPDIGKREVTTIDDLCMAKQTPYIGKQKSIKSDKIWADD